MLRNYFLTAVRFLSKNQLHTLINTSGLAVGLSCMMVIYLFVANELTYDEFHNDIDRLYVLGEGSRDSNPDEAAYYQTVYPALPAMMEEFPEIETGTRYFDWDGHILISGTKKFMHQVHYVDSTFLQTLTFPLLQGDPATALAKKDQIVISKDVAMKFFNSADVVGQTLELENGKHYTISGVLKETPRNSTIRPEVLMTLMEKEDEEEFKEMGNWYNTIAQVVIKLKPGADPKELQQKFPDFVKRHYDPAANHRTLKIYPLADLRQSAADNETYLYGLSSIAVFILLIAVINFMNLSIAASLKRLRETGMRKLMGSSRTSILLQFFLESTLLTVVAIVLSIGIVQLTLPVLNQMLGMSLSFSARDFWNIVLVSGGLALVIGFVAGGYPALYLSAYHTASAVKGIIPNYRGRIGVRNSLVVIQFMVSVTLIIGVIVTSRQIRFMKTADLKFNRENVLVVDLSAGYKDEKAAEARLKTIEQELRNRSDVISVSRSQVVPGRYWENYNVFLPEGSDKGVSLRKAYVDHHYLETYQVKVTQGRDFSPAHSDSLHTAMINQSALKALGWTSIEGQTLRENGDKVAYKVIGVFDDFHYRSLEGNVQPLIHFFYAESDNFLNIRIAPGHTQNVVSFMEDQWKSLDSWLDFKYFFADDEFDLQYKSVERTLLRVAIFTGVAIVICCAGIFALSSIAAQQRTKEIGIRKVLGASVSGIVALLSKEFVRLVLIAVVLAIPVAWYGMSEWLKEFAYKIPLDWWIFALAGFVAVFIAVCTTGLQSLRTATINPTQSLHND